MESFLSNSVGQIPQWVQSRDWMDRITRNMLLYRPWLYIHIHVKLLLEKIIGGCEAWYLGLPHFLLVYPEETFSVLQFKIKFTGICVRFSPTKLTVLMAWQSDSSHERVLCSSNKMESTQHCVIKVKVLFLRELETEVLLKIDSSRVVNSLRHCECY